MKTKITRIVIDGGPCSGKTTSFPYVQERFSNFSCPVFRVPETATTLMSNGVIPDGPWFTNPMFQKLVIEKQLEEEAFWERVAETSGAPQALLMLDRGIMGSRPYFRDTGEFDQVLKTMGLDGITMFLKRYPFLCFLRSLAHDKPELYLEFMKNNPVRRETDPLQVKILDEATLEAWTGCEHIRVIDNSTDFEGKKQRLVAAMCRFVGIPVPLEIERKYFINPASFDLENFPVPLHSTEIEQVYLNHLGLRIRKRGKGKSFIYCETQKYETGEIERHETSRYIDEPEYERLYARRHEDYDPIVKTRHCFIWGDQYFELDIFTAPILLVMLEIEITEKNDIVTLPPFLKGTDVTTNPRFKNQAIAHKNSLLRDA